MGLGHGVKRTIATVQSRLLSAVYFLAFLIESHFSSTKSVPIPS